MGRVAFDVGVPVLLAVVYGVVQWIYLRPVSPSDQMHYFEVADRFPDIEANHRSIRYGLILPVRFFQEIFGFSEAAYYAVPFLAGALLLVATYLIGKRLFDGSVGVTAAGVLMVSHVFLDDSSHLLPDGLAAALFLGGLAALLVAVDRPHDEPWPWRRRWLLVLAGFLFGWSYLAREYMPLLFPLVPYVLWRYQAPWQRLVDVAVPAFTVFLFEAVTNTVLHGNPLLRLYEGGTQGGRNNPEATRWDALVRLPDTLWSSPGGRFMVFALAIFVVSVLVRERSFRVLGVWFLVFWLPITLGTGLIDPEFRFIDAEKLRYWLPIVPAMLIGAVALAYRAAERLLTRIDVPTAVGRWVPGVVALGLGFCLAVGAFSGVRDRGVYRVNGADEQWALRAWLEGEGQSIDTIWTDGRTARVFPVYARTIGGDVVWRGEVKTFVDRGGTKFVDPEIVDGGALVLYSRNLGYVDGRGGLPPAIGQPGSRWRLTFEDGALSIYVASD